MYEDEQPLRYLPAKGESQTHVATLSGHAVQVLAVDPEDGKKGTLLHPRFHQTASQLGCQVLAFEEEDEPAAGKRSSKPVAKPVRLDEAA